MSRASLALCAGLLLIGASVFAQQPPSQPPPPPREDLTELRKKYHELEREYLRTVAGIDRATRELSLAQQEHADQVATVNTAQRVYDEANLVQRTFWASAALKQAKTKLREVSDKLARQRLVQEGLQGQLVKLRLDLITRGRALVQRLIDKADQIRRMERSEQADEVWNEAVEVMKLIEDLEAGEWVAPPLPQLPDVATEVEDRDVQKIEELADGYSEFQRKAEEQARGVMPHESTLKDTLQHLDRLAEARVSLPTLADRRARTSAALERVTVLRKALEERAKLFRDRVNELRRIAGEKASQSENPEAPRRG